MRLVNELSKDQNFETYPLASHLTYAKSPVGSETIDQRWLLDSLVATGCRTGWNRRKAVLT
jgi:hypothetical protein